MGLFYPQTMIFLKKQTMIENGILQLNRNWKVFEQLYLTQPVTSPNTKPSPSGVYT